VKIQWLLSLSMLCAFVLTAASRVEAGGYADAVLGSGPVAYYRMTTDPAAVGDALVNDVSPGTLDGIWGFNDLSPATLPISGNAGPSALDGFAGLDSGNLAAAFGGSGDPDGFADQMDLGSPGELDNDIATVSFFMKASSNGNDSRIFTTAQSATDTFRVVYGPAAGDASQLVIITDAGWGGEETVGATVNDNQWHNVVVVRNGATPGDGKIYVDGVDTAMQAVNDGYGHSNETARIGARHGTSNPGWGGFEGELDEFVYWDRALSSGEVAGLYAAATVPEPSSVVLAMLGLISLAGIRRFRSRNAAR
jgi:hypothetical protein